MYGLTGRTAETQITGEGPVWAYPLRCLTKKMRRLLKWRLRAKGGFLYLSLGLPLAIVSTEFRTLH